MYKGREESRRGEHCEDDDYAENDEIDLLHQAARTQAECADGLLPGAVVGTGGTLDQIGDRKKH